MSDDLVISADAEGTYHIPEYTIEPGTRAEWRVRDSVGETRFGVLEAGDDGVIRGGYGTAAGDATATLIAVSDKGKDGKAIATASISAVKELAGSGTDREGIEAPADGTPVEIANDDPGLPEAPSIETPAEPAQ